MALNVIEFSLPIKIHTLVHDLRLISMVKTFQKTCSLEKTQITRETKDGPESVK